jgi:hypothetical protein
LCCRSARMSVEFLFFPFPSHLSRVTDVNTQQRVGSRTSNFRVRKRLCALHGRVRRMVSATRIASSTSILRRGCSISGPSIASCISPGGAHPTPTLTFDSGPLTYPTSSAGQSVCPPLPPPSHLYTDIYIHEQYHLSAEKRARIPVPPSCSSARSTTRAQV